MTLLESLARRGDDDHTWECLMGDASPHDFVREGETLEAAAAEYADWHCQEYGTYEVHDDEMGVTYTYRVTEQDVLDLAWWIERYVQAQTHDGEETPDATPDAMVGDGSGPDPVVCDDDSTGSVVLPVNPHERADGLTTYGDYSGRDWRDDYDIAALLDTVAHSLGTPLDSQDRAAAQVLAFVLRLRMQWAETQLLLRESLETVETATEETTHGN